MYCHTSLFLQTLVLLAGTFFQNMINLDVGLDNTLAMCVGLLEPEVWFGCNLYQTQCWMHQCIVCLVQENATQSLHHMSNLNQHVPNWFQIVCVGIHLDEVFFFHLQFKIFTFLFIYPPNGTPLSHMAAAMWVPLECTGGGNTGAERPPQG